MRADYLRGDPEQEGPITRGRLALEPRGLRFSARGAPDLRIALRDMEGLTVSGRSRYEHPRRAVRGTMFVAARRNGTVDVWEFAIERRAGAMLQDRINRELHARRLRRPPLPFVEQIVGPIASPEDSPGAASNGHAEIVESDSVPKRPRAALIAILLAVVIVAEIVVILSLIR